MLRSQGLIPEMVHSKIEPVAGKAITIAIPGEPGLLRTFKIPAENVALPLEVRVKPEQSVPAR